MGKNNYASENFTIVVLEIKIEVSYTVCVIPPQTPKLSLTKTNIQYHLKVWSFTKPLAGTLN